MSLLPMTLASTKQTSNTQVIGAGPTGVEFTGELTDLIGNDVPRLFPELVGLISLTVVSSEGVLPMFDKVWETVVNSSGFSSQAPLMVSRR